MRQSNIECKVFTWDNSALRIPFNFIFLRVNHIPYRPSSQQYYRREESFDVYVLTKDLDKSFTINKEVYDQINEWIKTL